MRRHSSRCRVPLPLAAQVRRDHTVTQVSVHDIVVGDIVVLESGDKVPADGVLVEAFDITSNESSLTGRSVGRSSGGTGTSRTARGVVAS